MARNTDLKVAKKIFGNNFIGPDELLRIADKFPVFSFSRYKTVPNIPFSNNFLKKLSRDFILILGISKTKDGHKLTLNYLRSFFGIDPEDSEPCFYNQDWYLKENFSNKKTLKYKWYLIRKNVVGKTRGKNPEIIKNELKKGENFPSAILVAYTFFAFYFLCNGEMLWKNDFIWCSDKDGNGDRIYTGRYLDPTGISKNGFNIHRHLSIRLCYGYVQAIDFNSNEES